MRKDKKVIEVNGEGERKLEKVLTTKTRRQIRKTMRREREQIYTAYKYKKYW